MIQLPEGFQYVQLISDFLSLVAPFMVPVFLLVAHRILQIAVRSL